MMVVPFDVNDAELRRDFFTRIFPDAIDRLAENAEPLWGKMRPQHMAEHLVWALEASGGKIVFTREIPEHRGERIKAFLSDNTPTPKEFRNPALGDDPPPFRFGSFAEAKVVLRREMERCFEYFRTHPDALYTHSVFGPLNAEEWERTHYKHCWHHLLQFGLIREDETRHT